MLTCPSCSRPAPDGSQFCPACGSSVSNPQQVPTRVSAAGEWKHGGVSGTPERFPPGTIVAERYRIVGLIGRGAMGEVYRADDLTLEQEVALKFLPEGLDRDPARLSRFLNEVKTARKVAHPNVCRVYDIGETGGRHYISMEYVDGEDLAALLRRIGRLPRDKAVQITRQLCAGLLAAHEQGILHRDLKPANVMLDGRGSVRITDFGLAALIDSLSGADVSSGTPAYMAPEQLAGESVTARSDLYALGLVMYELFTGKHPFLARTRAERTALHREATPAPPSSHVPGLDPAIERVILSCLANDPKARPASALAVAEALADRGRPGRFRWLARHPGVAVALGISVVAAAGVGYWTIRAPVGFRSGDRVLVADFANETGLPELDTAVRDAFEDMLGRSTLLTVLRGARRGGLIQERLGDPVQRLDATLAERICRDGGCEGYVTGALARRGDGYRIDAAIWNASSRRRAAALREDVSSSAEVLDSVHRLTLAMRRAVEESPVAVAASAPPTTRSLPAYQCLALANQLFDPVQQIALFRRAIELDPDFVDAYSGLAVHYGNLWNWTEYQRLAGEAYRRASGLPQSSRLRHEILYREASCDFDAEVERLTAFLQIYPFDAKMANWLAYAYQTYLEDPASALGPARRAYAATGNLYDFKNLTEVLGELGAKEEFAGLLEDFGKRGGAQEERDWARLEAYLAWKDLESLNRARAQGSEPGSAELELLAHRESLLRGRLREARARQAGVLRAAVERHDAREQLNVGMDRAWLDFRETGRPPVLGEDWIALVKNAFPSLPALATFSVHTGQSEPLASVLEVHRLAQQGSTSRFVRESLQFAEACLAFVRGRPTSALSLLQPIVERRDFQRYHHVLARVHEKLGRLDLAASEYEQVLENPSSRRLFNDAVWILDQFHLARAYDRQGDADRARSWYERFTTDWRGGDPDIPELIEARRRLAELSGK